MASCIYYAMMNITSTIKPMIIAGITSLVVIIIILSLDITTHNNTQPFNEREETKTEISSSGPLDLPLLHPTSPRTGNPYILAQQIAPQEVYDEFEYGKVKWIDRVVENVGEPVPVNSEEFNEFYKDYYEDRNTDIKVRFPDGSERFYRLYFIEAP